MPISYAGLPVLTPGGTSGDTDMIKSVNGVSPSPNYNWSPPPGAANSVFSTYGLSPDQTKANFQDAFKQAQQGYAPFQDSGVQDSIGKLSQQYGNVSDAYDVSGTLNAFNKANQNQLTAGESSANTASQKFQASQLPGMNSQLGASVIRSQALLPYLQQSTQNQLTASQYADSAKKEALNTSASIAGQLAQLQQTYTNSLAAYNSGRSNFALNYAQGQSGQQLDASKNQVSSWLQQQQNQGQLAENAREANLSNALANRQLTLQAAQKATDQQQQASALYLQNAKPPSGAWTTDNRGRVTSGQASYNALQDYNQQHQAMLAALGTQAY